MALRWDREGPGSPGVRGGGLGGACAGGAGTPASCGGGGGCDVEEPKRDSGDPGSGPT